MAALKSDLTTKLAEVEALARAIPPMPEILDHSGEIAELQHRLEELKGQTFQVRVLPSRPTMRVELIGHFKPCMTDIYIPI